MIQKIAEKIEWLGHDAFRIQAGPVIYLDPYRIAEGPEADIILITHSHHDHCSPDDVAKIQKKETVIVTEKTSASQLTGDVRSLSPGDRIEVGGVGIEAVMAYNLNKKFHPEKNRWLGFILTIDGVRVYHAGDTDFIPEMSEIKSDIALLPVSGTYVMTAEEAVEAARVIRPKIAIPMHYGSLVGDLTDAERFRDALTGEPDIEVRILSPVTQ